MITLQIEHSISDFPRWQAAFDGFAAVRARAGVRAHMVRHRVDDPLYLVIDLSFDDIDRAASFLDFLKVNVWASRENSPALTGAPQTRILVPAEVTVGAL